MTAASGAAEAGASREEAAQVGDRPLAGLQLRPIRRDDIAACIDVFYEALEELDARTGQASMPRNPAAMGQLFGHLLDTDPDRAWLAEGGDGVAAFGIAMQRESAWFLSFLFVRPGRQATGVGRRVLLACLPAGVVPDRPVPTDGPTLGTCIDAVQPISAGLYARCGMVPRVPVFACLGRPRAGALPGLPATVEAVAFESLARADHASLAAAVETLDRATLGYARPSDHRWWRALERRGYLYRDGGDGSTLGYGYAHPSGRVGPVAALDGALLPGILGHLLGAVQPVDGWQVIVPGPASAALRTLLAAGMRFQGTPGIYCATDPGGPAFDRYLPATFALL